MKEEENDGFYITFEDGTIFKQLVEVCKDLLCDVNIQICEDGMHMQAMDASHVSLTNFFLAKDNFLSYVSPFTVTVAVSLKSLSTILKCYKDNYQLSLFAKGKNPDTMDIVMLRKNSVRSNKKGSPSPLADGEDEESQQQYTFMLNLMQIEQEFLDIPKDEVPDCEIKMNSNDFNEFIKNISVIGSSLELKTIGKLVEFNASGDLGKVSACQSFSKRNMKFNRVGNYSLHLNTRYLSSFAKGSFFSNIVELRIKDQQPLQMRYQNEKGSFLEFFLAPKFEDE